MGGSWFGSLDLAFKYAIVFGGLLVLTLLAGFIKVIYDRRKKRKLIAKEDPGARSDEEELHMREKDEGDLFGIRAIEAGFFGGVAQSRPTSVVNSPATTPRGGNTPRSGSPAPSNRNSMAGPKPLNGNPVPRPYSPSSSVLNLSQYGQRQSSADTIEPAPPRAGTPSGLRQVSSFSQDVDGRSGMRKDPPSQIRVPSQARLQPSDAELNGRINHSGAVNMSLEVPPSPLRLSLSADMQQHPEPHSPTSSISHEQEQQHYTPDQPQHYRPQKYEPQQDQRQHYEPQRRYEPQQNEPQQHSRQQSGLQDRNSQQYDNQYLHPDPSNDPSRLSTASSRYSWRNSVMKDYSSSPPQLSLPGDLGLQAFEVHSDDNPHGHDTSMRGSIISSTNKSHGSSESPPRNESPVPNLPSFPAKAVVDSSSSRYDGYRNERAARSPMASPIAEAHDPLMGGNTDNRHSSMSAYHDEGNVASFRSSPSNLDLNDENGTEIPDHSSVAHGSEGARTSFSYARTEPEYTGQAHRPPRPARQLGEGIPMSKLQSNNRYSNQAAGHYVPAKSERNQQREYVPTPGGKGGDFF